MPDNRKQQGAGCTTNHQGTLLYWEDRKRNIWVPLSKSTNVSTFHLAPGYTKYHAFCAEADLNNEDDYNNPMCQVAEITDDEDSDNDDHSIASNQEPPIIQPEQLENQSLQGHNEQQPNIPMTFDLDLNKHMPQEENKPMTIQDNEEDRQPSNVAAKFLKYHIKFGHCFFQVMARQGLLPKQLATCNIPICSACQYGKVSKRPWRQKTIRTRKIGYKPTTPGEVVSVDQMISATPGLIAQMSRFLTKDRYTCTTVFVDHFLNAGYVHLQQSTLVEHTLKAKRAFEHYACQNGVTIKHYHADNGTFAAKGWVQACAQQRQGLSFAATNAHHQNGKAEVRIHHLQEMARSMLLNTNKRWPAVILAHLWLYAVRMANDLINSTLWLSDVHKRTPNQKFFDTEVTKNPKHWYHFGCPVYVLNDALQQGHRRPRGGKWAEQARVGCYLGWPPIHARNVGLVLNIQTARVSPQFHIRADNLFH